MVGLATAAFARTDDAKKQPNRSTQVQSINGNYDFEPPYYNTFLPVNLTPLNKLRYIFGYKGRNRDSKYHYTRIPAAWSKFQLIVDEAGHLIDCTLLESSNPNKDNTVLNFLPNSDFFSSPGTLNGEPCKSIVLLSMCYYVNGDLDEKMDSYPVMNLTDSEMDTASADSAPKN